MRNGKFLKRRKRYLKKKPLALVLTLVMLLSTAIGGTLAWLVDSTPQLNNTFTTADINVTLTETFNTDTNGDNKNDAWKAQLIPGYTYTKDPKVEVSFDSVDCYLFVKFEENNNPSNYLTYTSTLTTGNGWTKGDGTDIPGNVWYRKVMTGEQTRSWELLSGNTITVRDTVTKKKMPTTVTPELVYTAYASQLYKENTATGTDTYNEFTVKEAWDNVKPSSN